MSMRSYVAVLVFALTAALLAPAAGPALADPPPFGDREGFANIMPPGQNGRTNAAEALAAQGGTYPEHYNDQTPLYESLVYEGGLPVDSDPNSHLIGVTDGDQARFFKDGSYSPGAPARTYEPTDGVTITRSDDFGVPTIVGETREAAMFGAGYVTAEDRMFLMDLLRHVGRARMSEFLGASDANLAMDRQQLRVAPYREEELTAQVAAICAQGEEGKRACEDAEAYTRGVNAFFAEARRNPALLPAEYPALQIVPEDWKTEDIVAIASLVGGIFGRGGGNEIGSGRFLSQLQARHGAEEGHAIWADFRSGEDPEAPITATRAFPYNQHTAIDARSTALLDLDSADAAMAQMASVPLVADGPFGTIDLSGIREGSSNAILATAEVSDGGKPIAVFGPQTGYFTPQLLVEMDIHGPGISARGSAFAGTNIYVQLGRGDGYAWSATSASADNVDQWVLELCNTDGSPATEDSTAYVHGGTCTPMDIYTHRQVAKPTAGGVGEEIIIEDEVQRSVYGPVVARATVQGAPVAVAVQRSTYGAELASAVGFQRINDPDFMSRGVEAFNEAFDGVEFTFNWFYVDDDDIAYKHSCLCPIRHPGSDPDLPTWGTGEWDWTGEFLQPAQQPQAVNPSSGFLTNWNNKQAPGFRANDAQFNYGSTYRSEFLATRMRAALAGARKLSRGDMVNVMADAGTVDLNGQEIYPLVLQVLGTSAPDGDAQVQRMRDVLADWVAAGGHRRDLDADGTYDHAVAVSVGDAFLRPALDAVFGDEVGEADLPQVVEDHPRLGVGSAYNGGRAGFLHKDLRQVLEQPVAGPRSRTYCGAGALAACRAALWAALGQAHDVLAEEFDTDEVDAWVYDSSQDEIVQRAAGITSVPNMQWQNRPTFQQVVQVSSRTGRVSGPSRFSTSAAVSRQGFPEGAEQVVIASGEDFPDALAGTPLAARMRAPVLLTSKGGLNPEIAREVRRLGPASAVVLGGTGAVSDQVVADLEALDVEVERIGGRNRFDTARLIAERIGTGAGSAVVASGEVFADALAAGPFASATGQPILLVGRSVLPGETAAALDGRDAAVIAGGTAAVEAQVSAAMADHVASIRRVAGPNRFATGAAFAEEARAAGQSVADTYVVTGLRFPDALSAGGAAAQTGGVLLLAPPARLDQAPSLEQFLRTHAVGIDRLWVVGGQSPLPSSLRAQMEAAAAR